MHFSSLGQVLAKIQQQPGWEQYQQYCQLLECWEKTVSKNLARFARPLYIKKEVLWVATSSSARAQELAFQRYSLLKQLNSQLPFSLKDIRFSTSGWQSEDVTPALNAGITLVEKKPRTDSERSLQVNFEAANQDPQAMVRRWIEITKAKNNQLQSCPECGVSTPEAELKRWNLCHHCIAKKWSTKYRPPT